MTYSLAYTVLPELHMTLACLQSKRSDIF